MHIRKAVSGDFEWIREKTAVTCWDDLSDEEQARISRDRVNSRIQGVFDDLRRRPGMRFLVAEEEGLRVGYIWVGENTDTFTGEKRGFIFDFYVEPSGRGKGVGQALMKAGEDLCRSRGQESIALMVAARNRIAHELYLKIGYEDRRVIMVKRL